jgi:hypothetical protein
MSLTIGSSRSKTADAACLELIDQHCILSGDADAELLHSESVGAAQLFVVHVSQ